MKHHSPLQQLTSPIFDSHNLSVYIKRDDLIHPFISGNKWRKCHFLLKYLVATGYTKVVTFGGAYSNHIHAFSYACNQIGIKSIGIIRGEELASKPLNSTLSFAKENGMDLIFVSRDEYKKRYQADYLQSLAKYHNAYIVPEGGSTLFAVAGFKEMLDEIRYKSLFQTIFVPIGSGGTIGGINANLLSEETVIGINVLKGTEDVITETIQSFSSNKCYMINNDYHFGGYAKYNQELLSFINKFEDEFQIELDEVYSAKMFFAFFDMVYKGKLNNQTIVLCHTGGLQGKIHTRK